MARRRHLAAPQNHDRWLISYADFVTPLLAVFVFLFASSHLDKTKVRRVSDTVNKIPSPRAVPDSQPAVPDLMPSMTRLAQALAAELRTGRIEVHWEARGLVVSLRQAAFFPSGEDVIATSGFSSLEKIAGTIRDLPNPVRLEGHTDSAPIHTRRFRSNWELSTARSIAVLELLKGRYGIPGSRFAVSGYADTQPVDSNDSAEGRAHNRRVDIVILNR